jgi:hypothetical protein
LRTFCAISKLLRTALQFKKKDQTANWTKDLIVILKMFKRTKKKKRPKLLIKRLQGL